MRLWQKIFLLTLSVTALAANSISLMLLTRNHAHSLSLAGERIRTICDGAVLELGHLIQAKKEEKGCLMLTEGELRSLISKARLDGNGQLFLADSSVSTESYQNGEEGGEAGSNEIRIEPITGNLVGQADGEDAFFVSVGQLPQEAESARTELVEQEGGIRIRKSTTAFWEGNFYRVEVSSDLAGLFERFREDLEFGRRMSGSVSLLTAGVLLCSVLWLTGRLKRLEAATERIAGGEYGYRIGLKGYDETAELSGHMDAMAAEIEAGIRRTRELVRERETFIANMAHELKTPLTSILGFADIMMIKSEMDEAERREYASVIAAEAKRLKILSSRLMELISIQEAELVLRPVNLGKLTRRALKVFSPVCAKRQCPVRSRLQDLWVEADEALLTSLVLNLLDNASKASGPGQEIEVTLEEGESGVLLAVRDHGTGIPEAEIERVTEAFYMVDKARSRSEGGSGVGLALCRAIVEAHHGTLRIESREGQGTGVFVLLPLGTVP